MLHAGQIDTTVQVRRIWLNKIQNVVQYLESTYQEHYVPYQNIAVDESTVVFKTYNKQKPTKWGLRVFLLSDSQNGYIYAMLPYYGSHTRELLQDPANLNYTGNIVMHLSRSLKTNIHCLDASGYHIYTDRFYSSNPLRCTIHLENTSYRHNHGQQSGQPL